MTERIVIPDDTVYTEYRCELAPGMGISFVGEEGAMEISKQCKLLLRLRITLSMLTAGPHC